MNKGQLRERNCEPCMWRNKKATVIVEIIFGLKETLNLAHKEYIISNPPAL